MKVESKHKEYKQIIVSSLKDYEELKGKIVDKVAFSNLGDYNEQMFIITFTDKTYVAVGTDYNDWEQYSREPKLKDYYVHNPKQINNGDFRNHIWVDSEGGLHFDRWIQILIDLGLWNFTMEDAQKIIEEHNADKEKKEYEEYLRLKEKFEGNERINKTDTKR